MQQALSLPYGVGAFEDLTLPDSGGIAVTSVTGSPWIHDIKDQKIAVEIEVTELCAGDAGLDARIEQSVTGNNWATVVASCGFDLDTTGLNSDVKQVDLSGVTAPRLRFVLFSDGVADTGDNCGIRISYGGRE